MLLHCKIHSQNSNLYKELRFNCTKLEKTNLMSVQRLLKKISPATILLHNF